MPIGVILNEFPTLGKLDSLVASENFLMLETQTIDWGENAGTLKGGDVPRYLYMASSDTGK